MVPCGPPFMTDIEAWENRLVATFGHGGIVGATLSPLVESEAAYGAWVADSFRGFMTLSEAFLVFHFETPELINRYLAAPMTESKTGVTTAHAMSIVRHAVDFRTLRAARQLLFQGAPYQGLMLMRPVFDAALVRSAIVQGLTTIEAVEGLVGQQPGQTLDRKAVRGAKIKEEKRIDSIMLRSDSGLTETTQRELQEWEGLLHAEIHGGSLSSAAALGWLRGVAPLVFPPSPNEHDAAMIMNRWVEVAWLVHRLVPTLQHSQFRFPQDWRERWTVLDQSFEPMVQSLSTQLGKGIGNAMVEFVNAKFPFNADAFAS